LIDMNSIPLIIGGAVLVLLLLLLLIGRSRRRRTKPVESTMATPPTAPVVTEAWLEFTTADGQVLTFNLDKPSMVVGRDSICDIALPTSLANIDSVSRQHARFQRDQDGLIVHDLDSKNGLKVNGRHTLHNLLENGDRLTFGSVAATFHNQR